MLYFASILFGDIVSFIDLQLLHFKVIHYTIIIVEVVTLSLFFFLSEPCGIYKIEVEQRTTLKTLREYTSLSLLPTGFAGVWLPHAAS